MFDVNDFDECYPGPWEWDVKRLVASIVVAARENELDEATSRSLALKAVEVYRRAMRRFARLAPTDVWYYHVGAEEVQELFDEKASKKAQKTTRKTIEKALTKTQGRTLQKLTYEENGKRVINSEPPLLIPLRELDLKSALAPDMLDAEFEENVEQGVRRMWRYAR